MRANIKTVLILSVVTLFVVSAGCGGAKKGRTIKTPPVDADGRQIVSQEAREDFNKVAEKFKAAEKAGWNDSNCSSLIGEYEKLTKKYGMADAAYNVAVIHERCGDPDKARKEMSDVMSTFKKSVPTQQRGHAYLAYLDLKEGRVAEAEERLKKAVGLGRNTLEAVPAYTMAATILRKKAVDGDNGAWEKAQTALRTALAIDAKYIPALYQLARLYYSIAVTLDRASYLTLATLVVDQAQKSDPEFAPIYLVLGQIHLQKNELVEALKAFRTAFEKNPNFYEAYMAYGAINLNFRGYEDAKMAFEKAVALRPGSYDANMGLGVAARGLGDFALARSQYEKASKIDETRVDYIFNLGVLAMDYENPGTIEGYDAAQKIFERFVKHASDDLKKDPDGKGPEQSWVAKAKDRIASCKKAKEQIAEAERAMEEMRKLQEEQKKREAEMAKLAKQAEELAKKEAEGAATESVDEAALEKELAAEEAAAKAKAEADRKAAEQAEKEAAAKEAADEEAAADKKEDVKL